MTPEGTVTPPLLHVRDWDKRFENNKTRQLRTMTFVSEPVDETVYVYLLAHPDGPAHYCVWRAIVRMAARGFPRGFLTMRNGAAHSTESIALQVRLPIAVVACAIQRLLDVGELEVKKHNSRTINRLAWHQSGGKVTASGSSGREKNPQTPAPQNGAGSIAASQVVRRRSGKRRHRSTEEIRKALGPERCPWFDAFWKEFPCHEGLNECIDAFERLVHTRDLAVEIWRGAKAYAERARADPTLKLKYGQGWLNRERWLDENKIAPRNPDDAAIFDNQPQFLKVLRSV